MNRGQSFRPSRITRHKLNANIIVEEVKRREATCSKLKSVLLSEFINSIIYRERKNILLYCMAVWKEIERKILQPHRRSILLHRVRGRRTDQLHMIMSRNDTRLYLLAVSVQFTRRNDIYIYIYRLRKSIVDILKSWKILF